MNFKKLKIIFLCQFLALIILTPFVTMAQTDEVTWNYPVHPGSKEFKQLHSFSERLNAFNIPDSILTKMTTENLVKTCLAYPWWILITSRDNNQAGYDYIRSVFNGFRELEKRKDAGIELLRIYEKMMPGYIFKYETLVKQGVLCFQFIYIELLLSQPNILKNISDGYLIQLVQKASSVYNTKLSASDKYSYYSISSSCLILSRILKLKKNSEFDLLKNIFPDLVDFNNKGISDNKELLNRIAFVTTNLFIK